MYSHPAFSTNPCLTLVAAEHGGHLGFIARGPHRFWADRVAVEFLTATARAFQTARRARTLTSR